MDFKPKKREWVKNAAIIFLAVLLVLTFFSNTIMNHSLPEVATQQVTDGSIVARVRGTGTVTATGLHVVKAEQTREIRSVLVKAGQEVSAGDVLFILGEGDSEEIEAAQETLRQLQLSYQRTALGYTTPNYAADERAIAAAREALADAKAVLDAVVNKSTRTIPSAQKAQAEGKVAAAQDALDEAKKNQAAEELTYNIYKDTYDQAVAEKQAVVDEKTAVVEAAHVQVQTCELTLQTLTDKKAEQDAMTPEEQALIPPEERVTDEMITAAQQALDDAKAALVDAQTAQAAAEADRDATPTGDLDAAARRVQEAKEKVTEAQEALIQAQQTLAAINATIEEILGQDVISQEYLEAKSAYQAAADRLFELENALEQKKQADAKAAALTGIDLQDLSDQIERARKKLDELSGGVENQIVARVAGTVQAVSCAPGDKKAKDDVLCTIEVPDMGYTLSFSVTNDQARRLRIGDSATISNYYWGNRIEATLSSIAVDPKSPTTNKLLTFDLSGDVTAGSELTISVGQKSANYDVIIPNSSIRSDANGSFVLAIEARNSPLGNRYVARRVAVEVLAEDDVNSAVTGDLSWGDYVITTSNAPIKNGDMVRLADNS